jgi:hypothetical protein
LDRLTALEATVASLLNQLDAANTLIAAIDPEDVLGLLSRNGTELYLHGANLHVTNGTGSTKSTNSLGNVIIGYNELRDDMNNRSGSHMLVVGEKHNYSSYGGIVVGQNNETSGAFASVSGGSSNTASGISSSVSGGFLGEASDDASSVSGGQGNVASGFSSSVSGGHTNRASGTNSSVSGGYLSEASGINSSVSGGHTNTASTNFEVVP